MDKWLSIDAREGHKGMPGGGEDRNPVHLKRVMLKLVGRMSNLGDGHQNVSSDTHSALQNQGLKCLGIPRTEEWPKTGHADDWVYCDWV